MKKIIGDLKLDKLYFREIPEILNDVHIEGNIHITDNQIRNLNNFPLSCNYAEILHNINLNSLVGIKQKRMKGLEIRQSKINNLDGCPEIIDEYLMIKHCNYFTSLQGTLKEFTGKYFTITFTSLKDMKNCPVTTGEVTNFQLRQNKLESLVGMPTKCHDLNISENKLKTLVGCPEHITGNFFCSNNDLQNLDGFPKLIEGDCLMTVSSLFNDPFMQIHAQFERELRKRCVIRGELELNDPKNVQV
jgi:hypothetical protein